MSTPPPFVPTAGFVTAAPKAILRLEGATVLAAALAAYAQVGTGWALFALLFLVPDVSMLGYLLGRRIGAAAYNLGHSYVLPLILAASSYLPAQHHLLALALIWVAHIGLDRLLGYGLKYATAFGHTHLGMVGTLKGQARLRVALERLPG